MGTEALKIMKDQLMSCVQGQLGNIEKVDAHELGEAVDMIKDLAEAIYYCTITDSMEKSEENSKSKSETNINYYTTPTGGGGRGINYYPDQNRTNYYPEQGRVNYYTQVPSDMRRDPRQGRSYIRRRMYMEGKETHNDTNSQLQELEIYLQELSSDITEMIRDASPEERAMLHQKMTTLASKIV